ncbi:uncharacterized protein J4E88_002371 [Alternaria novae-zelandiae]|uniref:uncharacterized protein n=1 Tax=Alternaria novae-zelandiae TaxID=430562 RepID=UPI0020C2F340|nr:uncharacterized protein J4E88_002371 [Alternaria novae-zelandiae]KAI4690898.1 hypothetical protein J4E88_002371 [Alternaria novae-zelandiae]
MPFLTPKTIVGADHTFVWDAFPVPPPEAETWTPDPDSIARPGDLPDPRFNRDPEHDRRSKSFRREAKMLAAAQQDSQLRATTSTSGKSLGLGIGAWPAPAPRSTGYPRDLVQSSGPPSPPADPVKENVQISRPKLAATKPVARVAGPPKGTMELMSAPYHRRPETPVASKASTRSVSPVKSQLSAWELKMEKALAETAPAATANVSTRPDTSRKKSVPPHLRGKSEETIRAAHQKPVTLSLNPNAKVYEVPAKQEETVQDDVDILEDSIVALQVAMDIPGIQNSKDGLRVQQELLDRYIVNNQLPPPPTVTTTAAAAAATTITDRVHVDHEIKVKVLLIRAMEHEMDLEKVAPERELMIMQRAELDSYCNKVSSAHKHWWQAMGPA